MWCQRQTQTDARDHHTIGKHNGLAGERNRQGIVGIRVKRWLGLTARKAGLLTLVDKDLLDDYLASLEPTTAAALQIVESTYYVRLKAKTIKTRIVEPLIAALRNPNPRVYERAQLALIKIGKLSVLPLVSILNDSDPVVRDRVVETLGDIPDKRVVRPLLEVLHDNDSHVRAKALEALGKLDQEPQ